MNTYEAYLLSMAERSKEDLRLLSVIRDKIEDGTLFNSGFFSRSQLAGVVAKAIEALAAVPTPPAAEMAEVARRMHYPECWDTAAYPSLVSALLEMASCSDHPAVKDWDARAEGKLAGQNAKLHHDVDGSNQPLDLESAQ